MEEVRSFTRGFSAENCNQCGKCIAGCQYTDLTPKQAQTVMKKVTAGPKWYPELAFCIRCGKCDHRCSKDARPSDLQHECQEYKRRRETELPSSMAYAINGLVTEGWGANFFQDIYKGLPKVDRAILRNWATPKKSKDLLWIGCTDRMLPRSLEESRALRNIAKFGGPDDCCGVWAIQAGLMDEGYRIAKRLVNRLKENSFDRLVMACGHCQKVVTKMIPQALGIDVPFPIISIYDYFLEMIEAGTAKVTPVHLDAAISDPCFGYENGNEYLDSLRGLARTIGITISELEHNRENSICCGYNGFFNDGKISKYVKTAMLKRKDFANSGKKHVLSYCPGCHLFNHYFQPGYKSHYLLEETLLALDGKVAEPFSVLYKRMLRPHIAWNLTRVSKSALLPLPR
ncbi:MAG: (Fe-S)-binding protein [Smithellaceae bacterium]|nr:(Fe-S)-binding protein [Smithellaceae bacterium]